MFGRMVENARQQEEYSCEEMPTERYFCIMLGCRATG